MEENTNKKNKKTVIIIVLIIVLILGSVFFVCWNKGIIFQKKENKEIKETNKKENKTKEQQEINSSQEVEDTQPTKLDLDKLRKDLEKEATTDKVQICTCKDISPPGELEVDLTYKTVSNESIYKVIDKLKEAQKYEERPFGVFGCPPKNVTYIIGDTIYNDKFSLLYESDNSLAVGHNNIGYVFTYEDSSSITGFIESLT